MATFNKHLLINVCGIGLMLPVMATAEIPRPSEGEQLKGAPGVIYEAPPVNASPAQFRVMKFSDNDRALIRDYLKRHYVPPCPVGISHGPTGCFSAARDTNYTINRPLPSDAKLKGLPTELLAELSPLPAGSQYVMVDEDVVMIDSSTRQVFDAVTLVYAVSY